MLVLVIWWLKKGNFLEVMSWTDSPHSYRLEFIIIEMNKQKWYCLLKKLLTESKNLTHRQQRV